MTFTLNLTFGGLCLYVADSPHGQPEMFVLLPQCTHAPHDARLHFDTSARTAGTPPTGNPDPNPIDLTNAELALTSQSSRPQLGSPPVPNLTTLFPAAWDVGVPRALLTDGDTGNKVNGRIRFGAGSPAVQDCAVGGTWFFPTPDPPSIQIPIRVTWSMEVDADRVVLETHGINGSSASTRLELFPDNPNGGHLDLWMLHLPRGQVVTHLPPPNSPDEPDPLDPATHVACFYSLTGTPGLAVPLFDEAPDLPSTCVGRDLGGLPAEERARIGNPGLDLMCIAAAANPK